MVFWEWNGFQEDKSKDVIAVMFLNMEAFEWLSLQPVFRTNLNSMIKVSETAKTKVMTPPTQPSSNVCIGLDPCAPCE